MKVIPFVNLKGGVGKTTTCMGIAVAAADILGEKVLVIDMDPQSNLTAAVLPDLDDDAPTMLDVLEPNSSTTLSDVIQPTDWPGIDVAPSTIRLAMREQDSGTAIVRLRAALAALEADRYAAILIDTNPSIANLTTSALVAATDVAIVTTPSRAASDGVAETMANIRSAQQVTPHLCVGGIIINAFDIRIAEEKFRVAELRELYPDEVLDPIIPNRAVLKTAMGEGSPVSSMTTPPAKELTGYYRDLAAKLLADRAQEDQA